MQVVTISTIKNIKRSEPRSERIGRDSQQLKEEDSAVSAAVRIDASNNNLLHAFSSITRLNTLVPIVPLRVVATCRLYNNPISCSAGFYVWGITMQVEEPIEGAQCHCDVDYLLSFNAIAIYVTEGTKIFEPIARANMPISMRPRHSASPPT